MKKKVSEAGKGDTPRNNNSKKFKDGYECIWGQKSLRDFKKIMIESEEVTNERLGKRG